MKNTTEFILVSIPELFRS